jgi:hypothetical protein
MTRRVSDLRQAAQRPARIARAVAIGTVATIAVGTVALVAWRIRRARRQVTLEERVLKAAKEVAAQPGKLADRAKTRLRADLREEIRRETGRAVPVHERILESAARTAASVAIGAVLKGLQEQKEPAAAAGARR